MKVYACMLLVAAASLAAQQSAPANPSSQPVATGRVAGHVVCSDTGKPARFASIQLMSEQSAKTPFMDQAQIAGLTASADGKSGKGSVDFGNVLAKSMAMMMKGSNLTTLTDMDGGFSLDKVPTGTYYIIAQFPGYLSPIGQLSQKERMMANQSTIAAVEAEAQKVEVAPGSAANLDISLDRGATIGGRLLYDDGSPAPSVTPTLMLLNKDGTWKELPPPSLMLSVSDDQGRYRFSGLPAGEYAVKATLPTTSANMGIGGASLSIHMNIGDALAVYSGNALWMKDLKPIKVSAGDTRDDVDIRFPIDGLHVVSGSVVAKSDGHPVNSGTVELEDPSDKTVKLRLTMIGKDGNFQFNYVPNGTYRLAVTSAADMEANGDSDPSNPLAMLLSGKAPQNLKEYGETGMTLTLPGSNSEGLTLQVPDAASKSAP